MGWWNTTTERDRVTWCSYYIFTSETNLYFWSVLHRELLGNISKYRLKTYTLTNPLNIKHPSNKIIKAFDNSRNSKNILKCFDDKKKSSITRTRIVVELKKKILYLKMIVMIIFYLLVSCSSWTKKRLQFIENATSRNERAVGLIKDHSIQLLAIVFFAPHKCHLRLYIDGHLISPK